ncbi:MAG: hypothetical protein APF76_11295 [Desulfitibacter sp. BRH_c19]|nr:MAG: hypothetical protein APF76_11295 [Desulfitibacter sp. BRH_c19]
MRKSRRLIALLITLVFVMICSLPVLAGNNGQGVGKGLLKKAEKAKYEQTITEYLEMAQNKIKVRNKHINFDVPPVIKEGRTLIPVRAITQGLGAEVDWDEKNKIVTVTRGDIEIEFDLESGEVFVNGKEVEIDVPPGKINNRVFVPLRFISEVLGEKVKYNPDNDEINIGDEVGDIKGYVSEMIDDKREAIEDVMVIVFEEDERIQRVKTDEDGQYILKDIPTGTYTLEFSHDDYNTVSRDDVEVKEDRVTTTNVIMSKVETEVGDVTGKVTIDGTRTGISNVYVRVYDGDDWVKRTTTDRNGEYTINDLPVGTYRLEFSHDDYETVNVRGTVKDGETIRVNATMSPEIEEGFISGKVTKSNTTVGIRNVYVRVYDGDDLIVRTRTDSNGEYTTSNVPFGDYSLEFSHANYETFTMDVSVEDNETIVIIPMVAKE